MRVSAKSIDLAMPEGGRLLVTRNDTKEKLTISVCLRGGRGNIIASVALDARGWSDLCMAISEPPVPPLPVVAKGSV